MIERLRRLLARDAGQQREYTFNHLIAELEPKSVERLALILDQLDRQGVVERIYRVESPETHGGIRDFRSLDQVPPEIVDRFTGHLFTIEPRHIRPVFKIA